MNIGIMHFPSTYVAFFVAFLALLLQTRESEAGLFGPGTGVALLTSANFAKQVSNSKHTVVVKYFANWCGHCKNFAPIFSQAAKKNTGIARFAAVDCDVEKSLCSEAGVQGFPTVIVYHRTKSMKKLTSPYKGGRTVKDLSDFVASNTPNLVVQVKENKLAEFFKNDNSTVHKVTIVKKKATPTNPRLKALAITHYKKILFAEIIDKSVEVPIIHFHPAGGDSKAIPFEMADTKIDFPEFAKFLKSHMASTPEESENSAQKEAKKEDKKAKENAEKPKDKDAKAGKADKAKKSTKKKNEKEGQEL